MNLTTKNIVIVVSAVILCLWVLYGFSLCISTVVNASLLWRG